MGQLDKSWSHVNYDLTSIDPSFMNLVQEAAAKLGMDVGSFMVETLREPATTVLNDIVWVSEPAYPTWEAESAADQERQEAESMGRLLREHAAVLASLREGSRRVRNNDDDGA
jgi:uncharacterized protein (DUF1778 family)